MYGKSFFVAPEISEQGSEATAASDVWSLGLILYILIMSEEHEITAA